MPTEETSCGRLAGRVQGRLNTHTPEEEEGSVCVRGASYSIILHVNRIKRRLSLHTAASCGCTGLIGMAGGVADGLWRLKRRTPPPPPECSIYCTQKCTHTISDMIEEAPPHSGSPQNSSITIDSHTLTHTIMRTQQPGALPLGWEEESERRDRGGGAPSWRPAASR
jgi:hypothetical protein